jgi:hypothetical protein
MLMLMKCKCKNGSQTPRMLQRPHMMLLAVVEVVPLPPYLPTARLHLPPPWAHLAPEPAVVLPPPLHHQKVNPICPSLDGGYISVRNLASSGREMEFAHISRTEETIGFFSSFSDSRRSNIFYTSTCPCVATGTLKFSMQFNTIKVRKK